jgi:hypothetical protein
MELIFPNESFDVDDATHRVLDGIEASLSRLLADGGGGDGKVREIKKPRRRPDGLLLVPSLAPDLVARGALFKGEEEEDASKKPRRNPESPPPAVEVEILLVVRI